MGTCILVRGGIVAWFAVFDKAAEEWCSTNYFGEWLAWPGTAPVVLPMTPEEQADCERLGQELITRFKNKPIVD